MGVLFYTCVAIDEARSEGTPFECTPSVWSFFSDYILVGCGELEAFAAMGLDFDAIGRTWPDLASRFPLHKLRGMPPFFAELSDDLQLIAGGEHCGWLTVNEFFDALAHGGVEIESCSNRFRLFVDVLRLLKSQFGGDRVVVIFEFSV